MTRKYSKKSQNSVKNAMHEYKSGTLKSGKSNKVVTSKKQAIAIGLSEARAKGAKVPKAPMKKTAPKKTTKAKTPKRKTMQKQ